MAVARPGHTGSAAVPVFAAIGDAAALDRIEALAPATDFRLVASPRHARILLAAGTVEAADREALERIHDQLPHPRAAICWGTDAATAAALEPVCAPPADDNPLPDLLAVDERLRGGELASATARLPDEPPVPWRGLGDYGQGGEGMMGGTPYGRPMAMTDADLRDGLMLDAQRVRLGPFLPQWPPGLVLDVILQGDVIQQATVVRPPQPPVATPATTLNGLERARAAHHLRCLARLLTLLELPDAAERCRRAACAAVQGATVELQPLRRTLRWSGAHHAIPAGLGRVDGVTAAALGGVVARAAGQAADGRAACPVYRARGFRPRTRAGSDVRARLAQWLDEAEQALQLAAATEAAPVEPPHATEPPWTPLPGAAVTAQAPVRLTDLLTGLEWHEARLVLAAFDLGALCRLTPTAAPVAA